MVRSGHVFDHDGQHTRTFGGGENIFENFIDTVRSGRQEDLAADILNGHISTAVTHVGNISYRVGQQANRAEVRERIAGVKLFEEMFDRMVEHLKAHEIDVDDRTLTLGEWLDIDSENEYIKNHDGANAIVQGLYRAPYPITQGSTNPMTSTRRQFLARAAATAACSLPAGFRTPSGFAAASDPVLPEVPKVHLDDNRQFPGMKERFEADYPGIKLSVVEIDGAGHLHSEHGGMRVFWIYRGQGRVHLPAGYRTQEGGPGLLPTGYVPDPIDPAFADLLGRLESRLAAGATGAAAHVQAVLDRLQGDVFIGDFAVEMWNLEHIPRPWSEDESVEADILALFDRYRQAGFSTKQAGSYEPVVAGDQLVACADQRVAVRGQFRCLAMERVDRTESHISTARRLPYLVDTAGGCSFDFDPYRRLPLTWYMDQPGMKGDGLNFVNAHVVNIPRELSSTHFHPQRPLLGGLPQTEMYLVLDPRDAQLEVHGREPSILLFPDLRDLNRYQEYPLRPGDFVYIPPGVAHRGLDVFVNVLTVPGFKPHNEIYIDRDIRDRTSGQTPYNADGMDRKNYDRLEDFL